MSGSLAAPGGRALGVCVLSFCALLLPALPAGAEVGALQDSVARRLAGALGVDLAEAEGLGAGATPDAYPAFAEAAGLLADSRGAEGLVLTRAALSRAAAHVQQALAAAPDFAAAHYLLGLMEARRRRYGAALAGYRRAARPGLPFSRGPLKAHFLQAVSQCQAAAQQVAKGTQFLDRKKYEEARAAYREAVALMPDFAEAHANLGLVYMLMGDPAGAVAEQKEAIRLKPDLAEAHYNLGNAYARQGRYAEAVTAYREAIRLKPADAPSDSVVSGVDAHQGAYTEAVAGHQHAMRYAGLANACFNLGDYAAAIDAYRRVLGLAPDFADAHYNLGVIYERIGDVEGAIAHWRAYLRLARQDPAQQAWIPEAEARLNRLRYPER